MSDAGNCFECGSPVPLRFFCTCGKRACIDKLGDRERRAQEIREWIIYAAGLRRAQELAKEQVYIQCDGGKCGECAPDSCVMFDDFNQAIDAEAAKERT